MYTSLKEADVRLGFDRYDDFVARPGGLLALGERLDRLLQGRQAAGPGGEAALPARGAMLTG